MQHLDVLIVGAGISGIDAAYHLQTKCPTKTFTILEARERLGGTWDLFRYPGIRSDSDMYTLGFPFRPWTGTHGIADGASILAYVRETAEAYGIDRKIQFSRRVTRTRWSSKAARWTAEIEDAATGERSEMTCSFLYLCTGYYDYAGGHVPELAGSERFRGRLVHSQQWTPDIEYAGKRVIVVGSGATAMNLVPELAKHAAHVTMLQRSPSYVVSVAAHDRMADWMRTHLPERVAYRVTRWKYVLAAMGFYEYCTRFPALARRMLLDRAHKALRDEVDLDRHFTPSYQPWDERVCFVPDGDLFDTVREHRATVVTDHIETLTESGVTLRSGTQLAADLIVLATGLRLQWFGGMEVVVDGAPVELAKSMVYRGLMLSGVPNLMFATGYTTSSWTLRCDLTSRYLCRLLEHMDHHGFREARPQRDPSVEERPLINLASGYVRRARANTPPQGSSGPWRMRDNYILDAWSIWRARLDEPALQLRR